MKPFLEGHVTFADGSRRVERCERNDARGREAMDRWALARLDGDRVTYVRVVPTNLYAMNGKGAGR